ncbi:MAG: hypothetical protein RI894_1617 [Bacteroidota bacterium]|jgi:tyrosinase
MKKIFLMLFVYCLFAPQINAQSIRKNYLEMTPMEKADYVSALQTLFTNGFIADIAEHHGEHFCTNIHSQGVGMNGENFLPWHRFFLLDFEENLRQTPSGGYLNLPYWDWQNDPQHGAVGTPINLSLSPDFWGYSDVMGGTPSFLASSKFPWSIGSYMECSSSAPGQTLSRSINIGNTGFGTLPQTADITNLMALTTFFNPSIMGGTSTTNTDFSHRMEAWHNKVHVWVGPTMNTAASPLDPSFYLHHTMIDKLWYNKEEETIGTMSIFPNGSSNMPHYNGVHNPNTVMANNVVDSRKEQRPLISGSGRTMDVWYAESGKVLLDGANGNTFVANDATAPYLYRYTAAINPNSSTVTGEIYVGDVQRDVSNNVIADNKGGFTINPNVTCDFKAGGAIIFMPGYEASFGSVSLAQIIAAPNARIEQITATANTAEQNAPFTIYPNPTTGQFTIEHSTNSHLFRVYDLTGQLLLEQKAVNSTQTTLDISSFPAGVYLLRAYGETAQKIIKL